MFILISIVAFSIIGFLIHLYVSQKPRTPLRIAELFLLYQLFFNVGLLSLLSFIGLTFMPEYVAAYTGWPACPFEQLLANVNLGYGVLGIMSIWKKDEFWLATIIGSSIWLIGDGIFHINDMIKNHNYAEGNIGIPLYTDILIPLVLIIAYSIYKYFKNKDSNPHKI